MLILSSACTWGEGDLSGDLRTQCSLPSPFHGSNKSLPEADSCGTWGSLGGSDKGVCVLGVTSPGASTWPSTHLLRPVSSLSELAGLTLPPPGGVTGPLS